MSLISQLKREKKESVLVFLPLLNHGDFYFSLLEHFLQGIPIHFMVSYDKILNVEG